MSWKSIISGWQGSLILMVCAGMLITSCAGRKHEIVKFDPAQKESFSARKQGPQISHRTAEELIQSGYLKLGNLNVEHTVKECWADSSKCDPVSHSQDPTTVLLNKAADQGADVVLLSADKNSGDWPITKDGECRDWRRQCVQDSVPSYEIVCDRSGSCSSQQSGYHTVERCYNVCTKYETVSGTAYLVKSSGTLWRHEPELAKKGQQQLKEKQQQLAFITAVEEKNLQKIKEILAAGHNVNSSHPGMREPALNYAVTGGSVEIITLLLDRGADINAKGHQQWTPLVTTISGGSVEIITLLLDRGANVNTKDSAGWTPLHDAVLWKDKTEIISLLLERGADINAQTSFGKTPLHDAAKKGKTEIISLLLERGADFNAKDKFGKTPLHEAVLGGRTDSVRILLDKGANPNIKNKKGNSPLFFTTRCPPYGHKRFRFADHCKKCDKESICREMGELLRAKGAQ